MSESNKRRRTSPDTYVAITEQENAAENDRPVTPKRLSYQSPTKASLARSNPTALQILDQAKKKRESEPNRRQSLRDAVLGNKQNQQSEKTPARQTQVKIGDKSASASRAVEAERTIDAFKDIPQNIEPYIPTPKRPYSLPGPATAIVPRLVRNHTSGSTQADRNSDELELPPTPVQLGKETAPERPRGLPSSSLGGSGRRRVRVRHGNIHSSPLKPRELPPVQVDAEEESADVASGIDDDVVDLPANSGGTPETSAEDMLDRGMEDHSVNLPQDETELELADAPVNVLEGMPAEASADETLQTPTNLPEDTQEDTTRDATQAEVAGANADKAGLRSPLVQSMQLEQHDYPCDPTVQEKLRKLKDAQAQLQALKLQCSELEALRKAFDQNGIEPDAVQKLRAVELLLSSHRNPAEPLVPRPEDLRTFKDNAEKYLTSFAPYGLVMSYETWEQNVRGEQKFVYQTTFAAPACWPKNTLLTSFDITMDSSTKNIESVKFLPGSSIARPLANWITERLEDPITRTDMATISTGIGAYFHEAIKRAKIFKHFDNAAQAEDPETMRDLGSPVLNSAEATSLSQHIADNSYISQLSGTAGSRTRRSLGNAKQLMLMYDISLSLTGIASAKVDITASGYNESIVDNVQKLFEEKHTVNGIVSAFEAVRLILSSNGQQDPGKVVVNKGKGKKPRRFTAAEFT